LRPAACSWTTSRLHGDNSRPPAAEQCHADHTANVPRHTFGLLGYAAMSELLGAARAQGVGVEFRILGPLEVVGTTPLHLTGQRERAVLVRLLLSSNQAVSSERLIEDVWEDAPPDNALRALPVYISRLRKALRAGGLDDVVV